MWVETFTGLRMKQFERLWKVVRERGGNEPWMSDRPPGGRWDAISRPPCTWSDRDYSGHFARWTVRPRVDRAQSAAVPFLHAEREPTTRTGDHGAQGGRCDKRPSPCRR
ncbi:hypothetical protein GCM10010276_87020 [Streptomyces longisporus]|uniref:Uncharacterized protein n=1 Tax=Streptomyces longisporus TaxID=1948 RepID=A0ABN3NI13_STRLO